MPNTLTSTQVARAVAGTDFPPARPGRLNAVHVKFVQNGASLSASDVIQFVAVPDHARIIDIIASRDSGVDNTVLSVGDGSLTARWISSASISLTTGTALARAQANSGYLISLSASLEGIGYETIDLTLVTASACVTGTFQMSVYYMYEPS